MILEGIDMVSSDMQEKFAWLSSNFYVVDGCHCLVDFVDGHFCTRGSVVQPGFIDIMGVGITD